MPYVFIRFLGTYIRFDDFFLKKKNNIRHTQNENGTCIRFNFLLCIFYLNNTVAADFDLKEHLNHKTKDWEIKDIYTLLRFLLGAFIYALHLLLYFVMHICDVFLTIIIIIMNYIILMEYLIFWYIE